MHIAVAGNIGAGKTTLTKLLAKHFKWEPHFEDVVDNPYLDDFYHQMERWSFNLQIYFNEVERIVRRLNIGFCQIYFCSNGIYIGRKNLQAFNCLYPNIRRGYDP